MKRLFKRLFRFKKLDHKEFMEAYYHGEHINDLMSRFDFRYLNDLGHDLIKSKSVAILYDISRYMKLYNSTMLDDIFLLNDYYLTAQFVKFVNRYWIADSFIDNLLENECHNSIKCMVDSGLFDGHERIQEKLNLRKYKLDDI